MKKNLLTNLCSLRNSGLAKMFTGMALLAIVVAAAGPVRAQNSSTSSLVFEESCGGSGTANDNVVWTVTSDGTESVYDGTKGIHYGTGTAQVQYIQLSTSGITGTITQVVVNASTANSVNATVGVTVGGDAFGGNAQSLSSTATDYTFTGSASGAIVVRVEKPSAATKALYVKSIEVTYTIGSGSSSSEPVQSNPTKYTSSVAMSALQVGDTLAEGFSLTGNGSNFIYFVANRHKSNENLSGFLENIKLDWIQSIGANCVFSTLVNDEVFTTFAPVDENGRDGDTWVVTEVESIEDFTNITIAGIRIPGQPHNIRLAEGTEDAANWSIASGNASVQGTQVLENVMSGSELIATYNGTQKVKSVKAVKFVAVQSIVLDKQTAFLAKDSTMTLSVASVLPENAADKSYTWSSDATGVASVNEIGVVTGRAAGTANIIATANDGSGVADTCVVTVLNSAILDGVTVLYASENDRWSTVTGYNPGVLYLDGDDVRLTSNDASLFYQGGVVHSSIDFIYPSSSDYQWLRVVKISNNDFYYHQGETWQQAIDANRSYNHDWKIEGGQVKYMMQTLVDTNSQPVNPTATIDPSTVDYDLDTLN